MPLINEILFDQLSENMYCTWHISTDNVRETFTTKLLDAIHLPEPKSIITLLAIDKFVEFMPIYCDFPKN